VSSLLYVIDPPDPNGVANSLPFFVIVPTQSSLPPRVLIVMPDQWPRALLRAALREQGYDAVGTRNLDSALRVLPDEPERGPVRLIIVDQPALAGAADQLKQLLERHRAPSTLLLARNTQTSPKGEWAKILRRPLSIADAVTASEALIPLSPEDRHPID